MKNSLFDPDSEVPHASSESWERDAFGSAFHFAAIGMALVSPDGRFLRVNKSLCNIIGYSEAELLRCTFQQITHSDDLQVDLELVQQMLQKKRQTYQLEKRYIHKNGSIIWVSLSVSLVWDKDDSPRFFISQIEDITARKEAESRLIHSHRELEQLLKERDSLRKGLLTICAWTKQIKVNDRWIPVEKFLRENLGISTSHGISDEALTTLNKDIQDLKNEKNQ